MIQLIHQKTKSQNQSVFKFMSPAFKQSNPILQNTVDFVEHKFCGIQKITLNDFFSHQEGW